MAHLNSVERWQQRWNKLGLAELYGGGKRTARQTFFKINQSSAIQSVEQESPARKRGRPQSSRIGIQKTHVARHADY